MPNIAERLAALESQVAAIAEQQAKAAENSTSLPWRTWLQRNFPNVCTQPFAPRQANLWEWFEALSPGQKPRARVEIWPRGGAKSATAELGCVLVSVRLSRRFVLYVSQTQALADEHVATIGSLCERIGIGRSLNVYGYSRGWRRSQLRTDNGFNVAAFGLDTGARGVKLDEFRPDLVVLDDIDDRFDTEKTTAKKAKILTSTLLPAGSPDCAVLFLQNVVHADSIVAQLADGRADFLHDREPVTKEPAVYGLTVEQRTMADGTFRYVVTGGTPTWEGQDLAVCEKQINEWGLVAFQREAQHETDEQEGGLWTRDLLNRTRVTSHPVLLRVVVGIDPNATEGGDVAGVIVAGIAMLGGNLHGYVLEDATAAGGPKAWAEAAVAAFNRHNADRIVAESNNGGEMVRLTVQSVAGAPPVHLVHASRGKITRAEPIQKLYDDGRIHHVGHFGALEKEQCTYRAGMPSPGRMDAAVWALTDLMLDPAGSDYASGYAYSPQSTPAAGIGYPRHPQAARAVYPVPSRNGNGSGGYAW